MRKYLLSAAAALAIATPAAAETSGYVDAGYESSDYNSTDEFDVLHLGGAIHHEFGNGWGLQADGRTALQTWDNSSGDDSHGYAAVHAYKGLNDHWDVGGYVGLLNYYGLGGTLIGIESRKHIGSLSLQGSVGYADFDTFFAFSAWDYRLSANWFFTPNFAVNGGIGHIEWDREPAFIADSEATDWSLGAAYQFANGFALYGSYVSTDGETDVPSEWEVETFRVGLRWNINGGDLQTVTNEGASWNGAAAMHEQFVRW